MITSVEKPMEKNMEDEMGIYVFVVFGGVPVGAEVTSGQHQTWSPIMSENSNSSLQNSPSTTRAAF